MEEINEILAKLTLDKGKGNQAKVANALGVKPQTFGNYLKGRKLPVTLINKWKEVYGEDLLVLARGNISTNVSKQHSGTKIMDMDVWEQIKMNSTLLNLEFDRLWGLIDRLAPPATQPKKESSKTNGK